MNKQSAKKLIATASIIFGTTLSTTSVFADTAVELAKNSYLQVIDIKSGLPSGSIIGKRKCSDGALEIFRPTCGVIKTRGLNKEIAQGYIQVVEAELTRAGYQIVGEAGNSSMFSEYVDRSTQSPDYLIGVTITKAEIESKQTVNVTETYSWKTEGKISSRWEIVDKKKKKIIFSKTITSEKMKVSGENIAPLIQQALEQSAEEIIYDSEFPLTF